MKFEEALNIGDEILIGKYRNKRAIIKDFGTDKNGQPTVKTNKGERNMYAFRVSKLMTGPSASDNYHKFFREKLKEWGYDSLNSMDKSEKKKFFRRLGKEWKEEKKKNGS